MKPYQPKTGQRCTCKPGQHRDNCPNCEGTGWIIDFKAIRAKTIRDPITGMTKAETDALHRQGICPMD